MSLACIIEHDALSTRQIETALLEIDGRLRILTFKDLEGFYNWFSQLMKQNDSAIKKDDLKLLIGDIQFLGPHYFSLISKVRKLMTRRGLIKKEEDLAIILTAFDSPDLDFKQIESQIITNIIFKPFDLPILKQHLQIALANQKAVTNFVVFSQKLEATAEMLKEVQLESFTELGFTTRSNRQLNVGDISKYYSPHFEASNKVSVLAHCISCQPHPSLPGEFTAEFRYLGLSNPQTRKLRQKLFSIEHSMDDGHATVAKTIIPKASKDNLETEPTINFLTFLKGPTDPSIELKDALEQNLSNVSVGFNKNIGQFLESMKKNDLSPLGTKPIHCLVLPIDFLTSPTSLTMWERICEQIQEANTLRGTPNLKPKVFLTSSHELSDDRLRPLAHCATDVIFTPIDRPYLTKRLTSLFPEIHPRRSAIEILYTGTNEIIRVANPIELTSLSEACLTMKYYRPISFHSFRRFCLPSSNGFETIELLASCYFHEKKNNLYINHFVFFGITDKYLKYIRKWILERYIASKGSAA